MPTASNSRFLPQQATYTAKEAATYPKVSERQIRNFITRKLLRNSKAQSKTLIPGEDVETLPREDELKRGFKPLF